ncbi:periplasmic component of the Tol biopolymer transport system [Longilinea arvoryzae]|uniref:Periplasmic component of the Tol biopolymer transport system n=1 Tax=Longilinea arvoryzae TaxID=360412 RepID=A0A0S7B9B9_9CHLR|nr:zinc ribbon domain-containing protein [Longilinea arvoryzae]GAP13870.1 periplasmic component of the Tol biopolymer transport system [Longilinea arvoryzae]
MICPQCGFENEAGQETCSNCGASLIVKQPEITPEKKAHTSIWGWVVAVLIVGLVAAALFIFKGQGTGEKKPMLYAVLSDQAVPFSQIGVLEQSGKKATPLGGGSTSLAIAPYSIRSGHSYLSSTGQLALFADADLTGGGKLLLTNVQDGVSNTATEAPLPLTVAGNFQSFSPDGQYFGYTSIATSGATLNAIVVNNQAATVMIAENMILSEILPDSRHFLAYSLDPTTGNPAALVSVAIPSGEQTVLFTPESSEDVLSGADIVSPDNSIYFVLQKNGSVYIYHMGLDGSNPKVVYTFKQPISFFGVMSIMPDQKSLLVMDANEAATGYDLYKINPDDLSVTQLASNVYGEFFSEAIFLHQMYGEMAVTFSPDGKHMAYMVSENDTLSLYVSDLSGQPGTLIASGQNAYSYAFTPDSDKLIYVQYAESGQMTGNLSSADFSGASTQLDGDVTSFNFQNGKLIYFSAPTADQTTSTLYESGLDGKNKTEILSAQPGYWVFLKLPE